MLALFGLSWGLSRAGTGAPLEKKNGLLLENVPLFRARTTATYSPLSLCFRVNLAWPGCPADASSASLLSESPTAPAGRLKF